MIKIGDYNTLEIVKIKDIGAWVDGGSFGEILLPIRYVPKTAVVGQDLEVFIYCDSEDRLIATTDRPSAIVGEFAFMKCVGVSSFGAFMSWGLMKDLLVPLREQFEPIEEQRSYIVKVIFDEKTDRLIGTTRLNMHVNEIDTDSQFTRGEEVRLLIAQKTPLGYKALVNGSTWGVLYTSDLVQKLTIGQSIRGYIKYIRDDWRIDLTLNPSGYDNKIGDATSKILLTLSQKDGFLPVHDSSPPDDIYALLKMSKKTFKQAVGSLYKEKKISISDKGITLL
jgi:uncharacterized protein